MNTIDFLKQKEVVDFIIENQHTEVSKLLLNPPKSYKDYIKLIVDQVLARQKANGKLEGWRENHQLIFAPPLSIEQASSEATSSYKAELIKGDLLVDLTGGMGIDCLALSEGFQQTIYVEQSKMLCETFSHNAALLQTKISIANQKAEDFLGSFEGIATFYLDPARRDATHKKVVMLEDCSPNLKELIPLLQPKARRVLVKLSPLLDLSKTLKEIPNVKEVHVVSVKNDCKELLFLIDFNYEHDPMIHAVNLETDDERFSFQIEEEQNAIPHYGKVFNYLYEPNSSILKSGSFKLAGNKYDLPKIASNTHLYSSDRLVKNFPGKVFEVMYQNDKEVIRKNYQTINVITRNYPSTPVELKKKYKLKDGGEHYLIGFRDHLNKPQLVVARRLS